LPRFVLFVLSFAVATALTSSCGPDIPPDTPHAHAEKKMSDLEKSGEPELPVSAALMERVDMVIQNNASLKQKLEEEVRTRSSSRSASRSDDDERTTTRREPDLWSSGSHTSTPVPVLHSSLFAVCGSLTSLHPPTAPDRQVLRGTERIGE
jgi:hypothetical protein